MGVESSLVLLKEVVVIDSLENPSLLIADDDRAFRETVIELLQPHFQTIGVDSGEQAIEVVETTEVDLAIFDLHMHVMSGLDAIRWLKQHGVDLPCILLTSDVSEEIESQAYDLETFRVLRKPPQRQHLIDTIQRALKL